MMKTLKLVFACVILFCSIVMISFSTFLLKASADFIFDVKKEPDTYITDVSGETDIKENNSLHTPYDSNLKLTVYNHQEKEYEELTLREYLICAVAGEMPTTFEAEALKAQAIAARTYVMARHSTYSTAHCKTHKEASVCTNSSCCQAYKSPEKMASSWGDKYDKYYSMYADAVDNTDGQIITYNGKPISVFYFSTSNGYTEACEDVFVAKLPYYTCVKSENEENAPRYNNSKKIDIDDFINGLRALSGDNSITKENVRDKVKVLSYTEGGRVDKIQIGNKVVKGTSFRGEFSLNSADFTVKYSEDYVTVETYGWGHGVGMSQNGANQMAKNGSDYFDILYHYYVNTLIQRAK